MSTEKITILGTIMGVIIGWLLTQLAQWYKGRKEDKRILKVVLYQLFEIRDIIPRLNIKSLIENYQKTIDTNLPFLNVVPEAKEQINNAAVEIFKTAISHLKKDFDKTDSNLHESVAKLSSVNPILAYKLSGNTRLIKVGGVNNFLEEYFNKFNNTEDDKKMIEKAKDFLGSFDDKAFQEIQSDFEYYIKKVALKINVFVWYSSIKVIKQINSPDESEEETITDEISQLYKSMGIDVQLLNKEYLEAVESQQS